VICKGISCNIAKPDCLRNGMTSKLVVERDRLTGLGRQSKPGSEGGSGKPRSIFTVVYSSTASGYHLKAVQLASERHRSKSMGEDHARSGLGGRVTSRCVSSGLEVRKVQGCSGVGSGRLQAMRGMKWGTISISSPAAARVRDRFMR